MGCSTTIYASESAACACSTMVGSVIYTIGGISPQTVGMELRTSTGTHFATGWYRLFLNGVSMLHAIHINSSGVIDTVGSLC